MTTTIDGSGSATFATPLPVAEGGTGNTTGAGTGYSNVSASYSMVRLNTANGWGSTNTKIRRFTNVVTNQGSDITYADSAANGASFTINTNGVYAISYVDPMSVSTGSAGISVNTSQPTTNIYSISSVNVLGFFNGASNPFVAWTGYLSSGDIVRPHGDALTSSSGAVAQFTITRVA